MLDAAVEKYLDDLIDYLEQEEQYTLDDIQKVSCLSDAEKVEKGWLIESAICDGAVNDVFSFSVSENNTKLRPGDKVIMINKSSGKKSEATILESTEHTVLIESGDIFALGESLRIEIEGSALQGPIIELSKKIKDKGIGNYWLDLLAKSGMIVQNRKDYINPMNKVFIPHVFNHEQRTACEEMFNAPQLSMLQGPPGTGKTHVLATIAAIYAQAGNDVLVLSNTHQAVNNALNAVAKKIPSLDIAKVGNEFKKEGLSGSVKNYGKFNTFINHKKKGKSGTVLGMSYYASVINLGLRSQQFNPALIIMDEAGQMPLAFASLLGEFGAPSVLLIGDDRQMPPIFHEKLRGHALSQSVFTFLCNKYPSCKSSLVTSYRMNEEITKYVSTRFYEPDVKLKSADCAALRILPDVLTGKSVHADSRIQDILNSRCSIQRLNVSKGADWEDFNEEEAHFTAELVSEAVSCGLRPEDVAVITPYRRQVRTIRQSLLAKYGGSSPMPLVDTVERLQGQDVEMIIISFCITSDDFFNKQRDFVLNRNRLNVMFSRAKTKVVLLGSDKILSLC